MEPMRFNMMTRLVANQQARQKLDNSAHLMSNIRHKIHIDSYTAWHRYRLPICVRYSSPWNALAFISEAEAIK